MEAAEVHRANLSLNDRILGAHAKRWSQSFSRHPEIALGGHRLSKGLNYLRGQECYPSGEFAWDSSDKDTKAVLLVGGMGTRLRSVVGGTPKPLAAVGERPFLELLVGQLRHQGIRKLVFCAGYLAGEIEREFGDGGRWGVAIEYSKEPSALGTAGAVKLAEP